MADLIFCRMAVDDWAVVSEIYRQGIATRNATFQQEVPGWEEWDYAHLKTCRIIAEKDGEITGWAALLPVSGRSVYAGVAEVTVYVSNLHKGRKSGTGLLEQILAESETAGIWTLQASIFPENQASLKMHYNLGFRQGGYREKIGKMNGI